MIVVGAGVIGIASAYALAQRSWSVTLVERAERPAMGASHANGAQLSYCFTDALGSPATLAAMPRLLLGKGGVTFRLGLAPDYLRWLTAFARNCTAARFRENTLAVLSLAQASRVAMERLCEHHELDFSHRVAGKVNLLYSASDHARAEEIRLIKASQGCQQDIVPRSQFAALDPALDGVDPAVTGAVSTPSEVVGDPFLFCARLWTVLEDEYGVTGRFGAVTDRVERGHGGARIVLASGDVLSADRVVIACGSDSNRLLAPLGQSEMIQPMKGYSFEMPATLGSPSVSVTDGKRRLVFTRLGDRVRVAGIAELGNAATHVDGERIDWLVHAAHECMPDGGDYSRTSRHWAGLRPVTPNSQPVIRFASPSIAVNTGHGALGWTLAMGSGERLADLLDQP